MSVCVRAVRACLTDAPTHREAQECAAGWVAYCMPPFATGAGSTAIFPLAPLLPNGISRVSVVDVGALSLGDGGDAYSPLLNQNLCDVVGFEPAPGECEKLNDAAAQRPPGTGRLRFLPTFVGDGKPGERAAALLRLGPLVATKKCVC